MTQVRRILVVAVLALGAGGCASSDQPADEADADVDGTLTTDPTDATDTTEPTESETTTTGYDRQETIDNLVTDAGMTRDQAVCVVDDIEESLGTDALDEAVRSSPSPDSIPSTDEASGLAPEVQDALTDAVTRCMTID